jgi:hypothetical protein
MTRADNDLREERQGPLGSEGLPGPPEKAGRSSAVRADKGGRNRVGKRQRRSFDAGRVADATREDDGER